MKVLLKQDVKGQGSAGDVKDVADGYGRNFLIPRGLAVAATPAAIREATARKAAQAKHAGDEEQQARILAQRIGAEPLVITTRAGEKGRIYGSVTSADVAEALERRFGQPFDKRRVELEEPIRIVGSHRVDVRIHPRVIATITIDVQAEA